MLPVAVSVVAIPARSLRQFDGEQGVDSAERVDDAWIIGRAQTKANQRERIRADDVIGALAVLARRTILDRNESLRRRSRAVRGVGRGNTNVVAFDSKLLCQVASVGIDPALDIVVPGIRDITHGLRLIGMSGLVRNIGA